MYLPGDVVLFFETVHDVVEDVPFQSLEHAPGLDEPAITVPGGPFVTGAFAQSFGDLFVDAHIEEGTHHSREGDGGPAPDGEEEGVVRIAEPLSRAFFKGDDLVVYAGAQILRDILVVLHRLVSPEDLGGDDEAPGNGESYRCQFLEEIPLVADEDLVVRLRFLPVDRRDGEFGVVVHDEIEDLFVVFEALRFGGEGPHDAVRKRIEDLKAESGRYDRPEKILRKLVDRLFVSRAVLPAGALNHLADDNGKVRPVDIDIVVVNDILNTLPDELEDIDILVDRELSELEGTADIFHLRCQAFR